MSTTPASLDRAACPECGSTGATITLLTSYAVYLKCAQCTASWHTSRDETAAVAVATHTNDGVPQRAQTTTACDDLP